MFAATLDVAMPQFAERVRAAPALGKTMHAVDAARAAELAVICHELRNSLAVVRGAARLLRTPDANDRMNSARSLIERHVGYMSRHLDDMLAPQQYGRGNRGLQSSRIDLRVIARDAVAAIAPDMANRRHRLLVKLPEAPIWAHVDGARLEQAFANLLINAAKYTPDGGDIALTMEHTLQHARIRVRDSGIGMDPAMLPRVFDMFVQAGKARSGADSGSGIGLAVVRNIVELHGGIVNATSAGLGRGSEFTVVLPAMAAKAATTVRVPF